MSGSVSCWSECAASSGLCPPALSVLVSLELPGNIGLSTELCNSVLLASTNPMSQLEHSALPPLLSFYRAVRVILTFTFVQFSTVPPYPLHLMPTILHEIFVFGYSQLLSIDNTGSLWPRPTIQQVTLCGVNSKYADGTYDVIKISNEKELQNRSRGRTNTIDQQSNTGDKYKISC